MRTGQTTPVCSPGGQTADRDDEVPITDESDVDAVLALLDDVAARSILVATTGEALSAMELAECCDVSQTTAYRKVEALREVGLLEADIDASIDGNHTRRYSHDIDRLEFGVGMDGVELTLHYQEP